MVRNLIRGVIVAFLIAPLVIVLYAQVFGVPIEDYQITGALGLFLIGAVSLIWTVDAGVSEDVFDEDDNL